MKAFQATESIGPAKVPMSLDVGRLTARDALQFLGLAVGGLAVGAFGSLVAWLAWPPRLADVSGLRLIFLFLGLSVALLSIGLTVLVVYLCEVDWMSYQRRLNDYHNMVLDSYEKSGGIQVERSMMAWDLTASHPVHVLTAALAAHEKHVRGEVAPHSVRQLAGDTWLGSVRLGDVPIGQAEEMSKRFAALGLVVGREGRKAGEWVPKSADEVVQLVAKNWSRSR